MTQPACYMPWNALAISASGMIKPCCQFKGSIGNFEKVSINEAFASEKLKETRRALLDGELPPACISCTQREEMVGTSRRHWFNEKFKINKDREFTVDDKVELIQADVNLSNVCNLKCRMCGSWASNNWFAEDKILAEKDPRYQKGYDAEIQRVRQTEPHQLAEILKHAKTLQRIDFKGGEPMLAKNHVEFLEELYACGGENIVLQYTTNGTVINPKIVGALGKFKKVRIMFSVEGTGELYNYIRGGEFSFTQLEETIAQYAALPNVQIGFNVTIQAYNLLNLHKLYNKLQELDARYENVSANSAFTTICNSPIYLSPFVLPKVARHVAIANLREIKDFNTLCEQLQSDDIHNEHWDTFVSFTRDLDELRGEDILKVVPDLEIYIK